jgi:hypothetical protein
MRDLTLLGHVAFLRHYASQLQALSYASPNIAAKLRQIAYSLDADADQLEIIASADRLSEAQVRAFYDAAAEPARDPATQQDKPDDRHPRTERRSDAAFADCLDAIQQGVDAALHWPRTQSD